MRETSYLHAYMWFNLTEQLKGIVDITSFYSMAVQCVGMDFLFCNLYQRNEKYLKGLCLPILFQTAYPWQLNCLIITGGNSDALLWCRSRRNVGCTKDTEKC